MDAETVASAVSPSPRIKERVAVNVVRSAVRSGIGNREKSSQRLPEVETENFISHSRLSFALLRWAPFVAVAVLPFTFAHGLVPPAVLVGAVPIAAIWLASLLLTWRTRNWIWGMLGFWALIFGPRVVGVLSPKIPLSQGIQWICLVVILAGAPLFFFRDRLLRFARLPAVWRDVE